LHLLPAGNKPHQDEQWCQQQVMSQWQRVSYAGGELPCWLPLLRDLSVTAAALLMAGSCFMPAAVACTVES
jgi:hypothetical protein